MGKGHRCRGVQFSQESGGGGGGTVNSSPLPLGPGQNHTGGPGGENPRSSDDFIFETVH